MTVPIHSGQFHLTLAYQFDEEKHPILETLIKDINVELHADWELQLFSRDKKTAAARQVWFFKLASSNYIESNHI